MTDFIVYDQTGNILRTGSCVASDLALQAQENEFVMEGEAQDDLHMISDGNVVDKPPIPVTDTDLIAECQHQIRIRRNRLLKKSDYTQLPDSPFTEQEKNEWAQRRQALRDLPATFSNAKSMDDIIWP